MRQKWVIYRRIDMGVFFSGNYSGKDNTGVHVRELKEE
jgi:hypothetical protein